MPLATELSGAVSRNTAGGAPILADARWTGDHGIGRFSREVLSRLGAFAAVGGRWPFLNPLDSVWLSILARRRKPAVYFTPGFNPPLHAPCPVVFVIHDLIHLHLPAESSPAKRLYYKVVVKRAARRAAFVLTVSEFSKAEIVEWAGIPADQVRVVGNGVSEAFSTEGPRREAERPYLLFVGNRKPHKNLPRVLEALARSSLAPGVDLYLSGDADRETLGQVERLRLGPFVRFTGSVTDAELAAFYRGALGLVAPSLYEGFGLPAIEAAACGCPVIASKGGAQAEVLGEAALLADAECVEEISAAMRSLTDPVVRARLIALGCRRAALFSWDRTGAAVAAALRDAMRARNLTV